MSQDRARYNRDDDQKPGRPPRPATEPAGSERSSQTPKTLTDPASGASRRQGTPPNQSQSDQSDGGERTSASPAHSSSHGQAKADP